MTEAWQKLEPLMLAAYIEHPEAFFAGGLEPIFADGRAQKVADAWKAIRAVHPDARPSNLGTHFSEDGEMFAYVLEVTESCAIRPNSHDIKTYKDSKKAYELKVAVRMALGDLESGEPYAAVSRLRGALAVTETSKASTAATDVAKVLEWLSENHALIDPGSQTLRWLLGPLFPGSMVVVGAEPNVGKTWFGLNLVRSAAAGGMKCAFVSCEDPQLVIGSRFAAMEEGIEPRKVGERDLNPHDLMSIQKAARGLESVPCFTEYVRPVLLSKVCAAIERAAFRGARLVVVDYLTAIKHDNDKLDRRHAVADVVTQIKDVAESYDLCVVLLAQLHRPDKGPKRPPGKHSFRETGEIEEKCEVCIVMWCDDEQESLVSARCVKGKLGGVGRTVGYVRTSYGGLAELENQESTS